MKTDFQEDVEMDAMLLFSAVSSDGQFIAVANAFGLTDREERIARSHWFNNAHPEYREAVRVRLFELFADRRRAS